MNAVSGFIATLAAGLFAGAAVYVTLVEHPARLSCGGAVAVAEFGPSYRRAAAMQASLAVVGAIAGLWRWIGDWATGWLVGALLLGAVVPFTMVVVRSTNARLLDASLDRASPEAMALLVRWGRFHFVRTLLGLAAFVTFAVLLARGA